MDSNVLLNMFFQIIKIKKNCNIYVVINDEKIIKNKEGINDLYISQKNKEKNTI